MLYILSSSMDIKRVSEMTKNGREIFKHETERLFNKFIEPKIIYAAKNGYNGSNYNYGPIQGGILRDVEFIIIKMISSDFRKLIRSIECGYMTEYLVDKGYTVKVSMNILFINWLPT